MNADKVYSGIMGLVVGDALGVPFEFRQRDTFKAEGMTGYGTHNQPPGTWSDDSSMTLATMESIAHQGEIFPQDIMWNFLNWLITGAFTPYGEVFDAGNTTIRAIKCFQNGVYAPYCGGTSEMDNGNGALMRILPLAFIPHSIKDIRTVAGLTHAHNTSKTACEIYVFVAVNLLAGMDKGNAVSFALGDNVHWPVPFDRLYNLYELSREEIRSTGYVVDTLEAALWCLLKTDSYRECVLTAVNLGGDTDTIAAVAGGLAGILYGVGGEKGIPEEWIEQIAKRDEIKQLCERFAQLKGD